MILPKIETFYKLNQNCELNRTDKNSSDIISQENLNIDKINSSDKIFFNNYYSTKYAPRLLTSLKIPTHYFIQQEEYSCKNLKVKEEDKKFIFDNINSYREIKLPKSSKNIINNSIDNNNNNKNNKKIIIIKSSDNLYLNQKVNTINANNKKYLLGNKSLVIKQLNEKKTKKLKNEKDEDKTILQFPSKILNHKRINSFNIHQFNYSDLLTYKNEIKKELTKRKAINYKFDNEKFHEHHIFFNNSFIKNNSWNNNILKGVLPKNINYILKEEELKKIAKNYSQSIQEKEKIDKNKNKKYNSFRNINNSNDNSFFNSEINNFYNNYKNNKVPLSIKKGNIIKNKIYYSKNPKNFNFNFNSPNKKNQNPQNVNFGLIKNKSYDSMIKVNSLFNIKSYN